MQKQKSKSAVASLVAIAFAVLVAVALVIEILRMYAPGVWAAFSGGDENALQACFQGEGRLYSAALLWLLAFVQVVSVVLPSMPVQLVAGIVLGPWLGTAVCMTAYLVSHMAVFATACHARKLLQTVSQANPKLEKMLDTLSVSRNRTYYTVMVLLAPGLPNGMIPYAAANSGISSGHYLLALLLALPMPTLVTCAAGKGILAGNWMESALMMAALYTIVAVLFAKREELPEKLQGRLHRRPVSRLSRLSR